MGQATTLVRIARAEVRDHTSMLIYCGPSIMRSFDILHLCLQAKNGEYQESDIRRLKMLDIRA